MFHDLVATGAGGRTSLQSAVKLQSWKLLELNQLFSIVSIMIFLQHSFFLIATTLIEFDMNPPLRSADVPTCSLPAQMSCLYATNLVSS